MGIRRRGDYVWWKWNEGGVRVGSSYVQMTTSPVYLRFCRLYPFLLGYKSVFLNAVKFTQMLYIWKKHEKQTRGFLLILIQKHRLLSDTFVFFMGKLPLLDGVECEFVFIHPSLTPIYTTFTLALGVFLLRLLLCIIVFIFLLTTSDHFNNIFHFVISVTSMV